MVPTMSPTPLPLPPGELGASASQGFPTRPAEPFLGIQQAFNYGVLRGEPFSVSRNTGDIAMQSYHLLIVTNLWLVNN